MISCRVSGFRAFRVSVPNAHHDLVRALGQRPRCVAEAPHAIVSVDGCATKALSTHIFLHYLHDH